MQGVNTVVKPAFLSLRLLAFTAIVLVGLPLHAERKSAAPVVAVPPQPVPATVKVKRGESVAIPLRIYGSRSQTIEFLIRTEPKAGKLSEIKQVEREISAVTYTPPAENSVTSDRFTYAARTREGVSAPCEVLIQISDEAPQLISPAEVNFGRLLVDEKASQKITLTNRGGGVAQGELEIDSPWQIEGAKQYRLTAGQSYVIPVTLKPSAAGSIHGEMRSVQAAPRSTRSTALTAEVLPLIAIAPDRLELKTTSDVSGRSATFEVINHTAQQQSLTLRADPRLLFERALTLEPDVPTSVLVETAQSDVGAIDTEIAIDLPGANVRVPVHAPATGAILHFHKPSVNFSSVKPGGNSLEKIELENSGGTSVEISLQAPDPFTTNPKTLSIQAGERKTIEIRFSPNSEKRYKGELHAEGAELSLNLPLEGLAVNQPAPTMRQQAAPPLPEPPPKPATREPTPDPAEPEETAATDPTPQGRLQYARLVEVHPEQVTFEWFANGGASTGLQAQYRMLALENDALTSTWIQLPNFVVAQKGDKLVGIIKEILPNTPFSIRVIAAEASLEPPPSSVRLDFTTPPYPTFFKLSPIRILLMSLGVCLALIIRKKMRS